jgi:hypothetical protein
MMSPCWNDVHTVQVLSVLRNAAVFHSRNRDRAELGRKGISPTVLAMETLLAARWKELAEVTAEEAAETN